MIKQDVFDSLKTIFSYRIHFSSDYLYYYTDDCYPDEYNENICYGCRASDYNSGATKIVLYYDDIQNWVVKLPFFGDFDPSAEEEDMDCYRYFSGANRYIPIDYDDNYCEVEAYLTKRAEEEGVVDMFAKTYFLGWINTIPVYVSERVEKTVYNADNNYKRIKSAAETQSLYDFYNTELDTAGLYDESTFRYFVDQYGVKKAEKLINFIMKYNIDDLSDSNIGFDKNGKIKIIDYSGFHY